MAGSEERSSLLYAIIIIEKYILSEYDGDDVATAAANALLSYKSVKRSGARGKGEHDDGFPWGRSDGTDSGGFARVTKRPKKKIIIIIQ